MPVEEPNQRIKFAYKLAGWTFENGKKSTLRNEADTVIPSEYTPRMEGILFCPECATNLVRVPKEKDYFVNGRDAYFAHIKKYRNVKCDLRTPQAKGKRYDTYEEARKAVEDEDLVLISGFLQEKPEDPAGPMGEYDETPVEDQNGPEAEAPIGRHNGEVFKLPSKITTVAGLCRNFDKNLYRYYHLPGQRFAVRLIDLLHDVRTVTEEDDSPKFYFGVVKRSYSAAEYPKPHNIRMTELEESAGVADFYLKASERISQQKGIHDDMGRRIVIMFGKVTENGIGLCIERLKWGEFALLPRQYEHLLLD